MPWWLDHIWSKPTAVLPPVLLHEDHATFLLRQRAAIDATVRRWGFRAGEVGVCNSGYDDYVEIVKDGVRAWIIYPFGHEPDDIGLALAKAMAAIDRDIAARGHERERIATEAEIVENTVARFYC